MGQLLKRSVHHDDNAILNIMTLTLSKGLIGNPHFNKDRDEVVVVLKGQLEIIYYDPDLLPLRKTNLYSGTNQDSWSLIKKNEIHQFNCLSEKVEILEILGGVFFDGACVNLSPKPL